LFKQRVMQAERRCRITGVENPIHPVASHCKPWRDCRNEERLDGENGLLYPSPGRSRFIGIEDRGNLIISAVVHLPSLERMGTSRLRSEAAPRLHRP
jgi:hypothetical protein